jgi:hypothetical protein
MGNETETAVNQSLDEIRNTFKSHGLELGEDGQIVWETSNPGHPRNWNLWKKTYNTVLILFLELVT